MNRRDFIKATTAMLVLPSLIVRPRVDLHRILAGFAAPEGEVFQYDIDRPFVQGNQAIATDARIMAWIPTTEADTADDDRRIPNCLLAQRQLYRENGGWHDLPPLKLVGPEKCDGCPRCSWRHGCKTCDGEGFNAGGVCPKCHGLAYVPQPDCWLCHGNTRSRRQYPYCVPMGDKLVHVRYYEKLAAVPGVRWNRGIESWKSDFTTPTPGPFLFRSDIGIQGLAMPIDLSC